MVESDLYFHLKNDVAVNDLVGGRIYPKVAPQNVKTPYLVYSEMFSQDNQCVGGNIYQTDVRFQVDCWSKKYSKVKALKKAVKDSLVGFKNSYAISTMDDYESQTKLYREMIDFKIKQGN